MFILLITGADDKGADYLVDNYLEYSFFRLNTDQMSRYNIKIMAEVPFFIIEDRWEKQVITLEYICGVYLRKIISPNFYEFEDEYHFYLFNEFITFIEGIAESISTSSLGRPSIIKVADNKIYQLNLARKFGFTVPESCITNDIKTVTSFSRENECIIKPISIGVVYKESTIQVVRTNLFNKEIELPKEISTNPLYLQKYQEKSYEVRAVFVEDDEFSFKIITSNEVDWRKNSSGNTYQTYYLPSLVRKQCIEMMQFLGLDFAIFDFIVFEGTFIFLEVNPNGEWVWLDHLTHKEMSSRIMLLISGQRGVKNEY